jgi:hypothetical protein
MLLAPFGHARRVGSDQRFGERRADAVPALGLLGCPRDRATLRVSINDVIGWESLRVKLLALGEHPHANIDDRVFLAFHRDDDEAEAVPTGDGVKRILDGAIGAAMLGVG